MSGYKGPSAVPSGNPTLGALDPLDFDSTWLLPPEFLEHSPSRRDMTDEKEREYRRRSVMFMESFQIKANIDWDAVVTAKVYFHYYYAKHSFLSRRHHRFIVLIACLLLAGKVTECPNESARSLTKLVLRANHIWNHMPAAADPRAGLSEDYVAQFKRDVLSCERTLLHTIAFDLIIPPNPMKFAEAKIKLAASAVPQEFYDSFCVKTFVFLKFAMRTSLCLQFPPSYLTAATVGLSAAYFGFPIILPGASGPVVGGSVEALDLPGQPASSAQGTSSAAAAAAATAALPVVGPAAHAVWQQVMGSVTGPEFSSLAAQILEVFKFDEGDAASAASYAKALEARLKALGVLNASAAHPGPSSKSAAKRPRPPPPPPPSSVPPPPQSLSSSSSSPVAPTQPRKAPPPSPPPPPPSSGDTGSNSKRTKTAEMQAA